MRFLTHRYVARGGLVVLLLGGMWIFSLLTARAATAGPVEHAGDPGGLAGLGPGSVLVLLLGAAAVLSTILGVIAVRRERPWPHWVGLTLGLGEAAFLLGILAALIGLASSFHEIARLGATMAAPDVAAGLAPACRNLAIATLAALVSLAGAGLIRLAEGRRPRESRD